MRTPQFSHVFQSTTERSRRRPCSRSNSSSRTTRSSWMATGAAPRSRSSWTRRTAPRPRPSTSSCPRSPRSSESVLCGCDNLVCNNQIRDATSDGRHNVHRVTNQHPPRRIQDSLKDPMFNGRFRVLPGLRAQQKIQGHQEIHRIILGPREDRLYCKGTRRRIQDLPDFSGFTQRD